MGQYAGKSKIIYGSRSLLSVLAVSPVSGSVCLQGRPLTRVHDAVFYG